MAAGIDTLVSLVRAPAFVLCDADGWLRPGGAAGVYVDDRRVLSGLLVRIDGQDPSYAGHELTGADTAVFTATLPGLRVNLTRTVSPTVPRTGWSSGRSARRLTRSPEGSG